jgi:FkbM family methyltransferase
MQMVPPADLAAEQPLLLECARLLRPERLLHVVDIGANPIGGDRPYRNLLASGLCRLTGFDPQAETLSALQAAKTDNQTFLPWALGDGKPHTLHICDYSGWSSFLRPSEQALASFPFYRQNARIVRTETVATRRLDDIKSLRPVDFLKIDVQGAEQMIFEHAPLTLDGVAAVQTEVSFVALYEQQPVFGNIDLLLRKHGLLPCSLLGTQPHSRSLINGHHVGGAKQLLEADILYLRDYTRPEALSVDQIKQLALLLTGLGFYDLALYMFELLQGRGVLAPDVTALFGTALWKYRAYLPTIGAQV